MLVFILAFLPYLECAIVPKTGWGGQISLHSYPDTVCSINNIRQSLLNKCQITCSGPSTILIALINSQGTTLDRYYCVTKPTLTSSDLTTLYTSTPYNLTLSGAFHINTTALCGLGSTYFPAIYITANQTQCQYSSIKSGTYTLTLLPNSIDSIGSISIKVLNSYRFNVAQLLTNYSPNTLQVSGSRLDSSLTCNFTGKTSAITVLSSSSITCEIPSNLAGSTALWLQNPALVQVSPTFTLFINAQITLLSISPPLNTLAYIIIEYTGNITTSIYCSIDNVNYLATYDKNYIKCLITTLEPGDYLIHINDDITRISSNSLTFFQRENIFDANFTADADVHVTLNTSLSVPRLYCKWGMNSALLMQVNVDPFVCPVSTIKDKGRWCIELSYDGEHFSDSCLFEFEKPRKSHFVSVFPQAVIRTGGVVKVFYDKAYIDEFYCVLDGQEILAWFDVGFITCALPMVENAGEYQLNVKEKEIIVSNFTVNYVDLVEIDSSFPKFISEFSEELTLSGRGFYKNIECLFNNKKADCTYLNSSSLSCIIPLQNADSNISCTNIEGSPSEIFNISYHELPTISSYLPSTLYEGITNLIYIQGLSFYPESFVLITCSSTLLLPLSYISPELQLLTTFMNYCNIFDFVNITLTTNLVDFTEPISLKILPVPNLSFLSFNSSPYFGGDTLYFYGNGYIENIYCKFDTQLVQAEIISYEQGSCVVPYHDIGIVKFSLVIPELDYVNKEVDYTFDDLVVFSIDPISGSSNGGTSVNLIGDFSGLETPVFCRFGESMVEGVLGENITCISPVGAGKAIISVIANSKLYSSYIPVYFSYISYPKLTKTSIPSSPSYGKSAVILSGTGFISEFRWQCVFGKLFTEAIFLNSTNIICYSPPQAPNTVNLYITSNGQDRSNSLTFIYTPIISVSSITPNSGPSIGVTQVKITGKNINQAFYCKIGNRIQTGLSTSSGLQCNTIAWWYGPTPIEVSSNGLDFTNTKIMFNFYTDFQVTNLYPVSIPNSGAIVSISGMNFPSNLKCRASGVETAAVYMSGFIICSVPRSTTSTVTIDLTTNSQNYINFLELTTVRVYSAPVFTSLSQAFANIGTNIKLTASNMINSPQFYLNLGPLVQFRFITSTTIVFKVPNIVSGTYNLVVSNNYQDSNALTTILVSDVMQVVSALPNLATITGGTVINVKVRNAVNSPFLTCMFMKDYEQQLNYIRNFIVSAVFVNSTHVTCTTPAFTYAGTAFLRVSNNNQTFSSSSVEIEIIESCKDRVQCTGNVIKVCPPGSYCLESFWYSPISCAQGSYNNFTLQTSCFLCPKGQVCTSPVIPSLCSSNFTCSQQGLMYPDYKCPPGYYCPTNTSSPMQICNSGKYCNGIDLNCSNGFICKKGSSSYFGEAECPEGFYCQGYSIHICPPRFFCKGRGNNRPTPCPAGTYNQFSGQKECVACPLGFVCPHARMLRGIICPKGYICDQEGLIFPNKLCTPGYYCPEGVATAYLKRPCYGITATQALDSSICGYDALLYSTNKINLSGNITQFNFTQQDLCCWNASITAAFISSLNPSKSFQDASIQFYDSGLLGISLYTPILNTSNTSTSTTRNLIDISPYLPSLSDQRIYDFYLTQLLDMPNPLICAAGVFCLEGVYNDSVIPGSVRSGRLCNSGTFCEEGSSTPAGQLCPAGFHCPAGSLKPTENSPGTSTGFAGNVFEGPCSPNFYSNQNASTFCYACPNGHECSNPGTIWPEICLQGKYRNYMTSSICSECPLSSFSYDFGIISEYQCQPCNEGRMCLLAGTQNISLSSPCTQGDYCEEAADISLHQKCPPGFLCAAGTTPKTIYDIPCFSGFYCPLGMKFLNKYLYPCPENCYCPPATYDYSQFYANPDTPSATSYEYPPTHCPLGTGKVSEGSRSTLLSCERLLEYTWDYPILEINPVVESISSNFTAYMDENNITETFVFHLESREIALITIDLLHLSNESFVYGVDWAVGFTVVDNLTNSSYLSPVEMPQSFLRESVIKNSVLEFTILAWTALDFKVSMLIYNGLFQTYFNLFENTTSVEIFTPNRNYYGSRYTFLTMIDNTVALPFNNPNPDVTQSFFLLTFAPSPQLSNLTRIEKVNDVNWFQPNTKFWGDNSALFLPYFPYFSNCKGYGQYIPVWVPLELSPECDLIEPAKTVPIIPFIFGSKPVADACVKVNIECIYDELVGDTQAVPRWFEVPLASPVFYLTQVTVNDDDFINQSPSAKLIPAIVMIPGSTTSPPGVVDLQILYQQFDQYEKRIILILVNFLNPISLTGEQQVGFEQTPYNLSITYMAMNQKQLLVNFVFDYTFYFSLFVLIGIITVIFTIMLWAWHKIFVDVSPVPSFQFFSYFKLKWRPPTEGFVLGSIPVFVVFILNSYLVLGYILGWTFKVAGPEVAVNNGIFDSLLSTYQEFPSVDAPSTQRARLGTSLIAMGGYIMWVGITMFILDDPEEPESEPKGNFWKYIMWKRMNLIFAALISIAGLQGLVQLSYSAVFGLYSYAFIVVLFAVGTILEYFIIQMLTDELFVEPINQAVGMVTGVATFGASDFVNFLTGYFVGLMNLLVMRVYLDFFNDWITGVLENFADAIENGINALGTLSAYKTMYVKLKSIGRAMQDDNLDEVINEPDEIEVYEFYDSDEEEVVEEASYYTYEDVKLTPVQSVQEEDPLDEQEIESILGHIIGYSGDLLGYLSNPVFTVMCWNYYDYIPFFSAYGINKPDVFLYVMFGAVMIPFQLATDIILHNTNELYNGWAIHDFLDFMKHKYANRKKRWIGYDPQNEEIIDDPIKNIYRVCFSPQFFFMSTVFDYGFCFIAIGFVTILNNPGYNAFDDRATIPIILFSIPPCYIVHKLTIIVANWLKIWEVQNVENEEAEQENEEENEPEAEIDVIELYNEIYNPKPVEGIVPKINNWDKVELIKADDEIVKRELDSERIVSQEIREKFLEVNKEWLREHLNVVFCDEHFEENRGIMLSKLARLYGFLQKTVPKRRYMELMPEDGARIRSGAVVGLAKHWLARARRNRRLMMLADVVLKEVIQEKCGYCGREYMLQCEILESVDDLFSEFKLSRKYSQRFRMFEWNDYEWIEYLREFAHFRTICIECFERCEEFYKYSAATIERSHNNNEEDLNAEGNEVDENIRSIAMQWLHLARDNLE